MTRLFFSCVLLCLLATATVARASQKSITCDDAKGYIPTCITGAALDALSPELATANNARSILRLLSNAAELGAPTHRAQALALLERVPAEVTRETPTRPDHFDHAVERTWARLIWLAASGQMDDVYALLETLQTDPSYTPQIYSMPHHSLIRFLIESGQMVNGLDMARRTAHLTFHKPKHTIHISGFRPRSPAPYVSTLLLKNQFDQARQIHAVLQTALPYGDTAGIEVLIAYARRSEDPEVLAYYKNHCRSIVQKTARDRFNTLGTLLRTECLRDMADLAASVKQQTAPFHYLQNQANIRNAELLRIQTAHKVIAEQTARGEAMAGESLENLTLLHPFITADTCRRSKDMACLRQMVDLLRSYKQDALSGDAERLATLRNLSFLYNAPKLAEADMARFKSFDVDAFEREYILQSPLPPPAIPPRWQPSSEALEKANTCSRAADDVTGVDYAGCLLRTLQPSRQEAETLRVQNLRLDKYIINPYTAQ